MSPEPTQDQFNRVVIHLQSEDANMRKRAIQWLVKNSRSDALRPLEWTAESDPDPEVRTYAQKAVRFLKSQTQTMPAVNIPPDQNAGMTMETRAVSADAPQSLSDLRRKGTGPLASRGTGPVRERPGTGEMRERRGTGPLREDSTKRRTLLSRAVSVEPDPEPEPEEDITGSYFSSHEEQMAAIIEGYEVYAYQDPSSPDYVSRDHWEQSRTLMNEAYSQFIHDEPVSKVVSTIGRSIDLDKKVVEEEPAKRAIIAATEMPIDRAVSLLVDKDARQHFISQLRKKERYGLRVYSTWTHVVVDLVAYLVTHVVGLTALLYFMSTRSRDLIANLNANENLNAQIRISGVDPAAPFRSFASTLSAYTMTDFALYALMTGAVLTLLLVIGHLVTHGILSIMEGNASLMETLANLNQVALWMTIATYVVTLGLVVALFPTVTSDLFSFSTRFLNIARYLLLIPALILVGQQVWHMVHLHEVSRVAASVAYIVTGAVIVGIGYGIYIAVPAFSL